MAKRTRKLERFRIDEISLVDFPAQEGARVRLMKREAEESLRVAEVGKGLRLTTSEDGHAHLIRDEEPEGGETSWAVSKGEEHGHSHPWIRRVDGAIVIGEAEGHSHGLLEKRVPISKAIPKPKSGESREAYLARFMADKAMRAEYPEQEQRAAIAHRTFRGARGEKKNDESPASEGTTAAAPDTLTVEGESTMTPQPPATPTTSEESAVAKRVEALENENRRLRVLADLSDVEKAHLRALDANGSEAFLKLDLYGRAAELKKAEDANPEVYKATDGRVFRKNDDPRLVAEVRENDTLRKNLAEEAKRNTTTELTKRAQGFAHLALKEDELVEMLRAVDGISDVAKREAITKGLLAHDARIGQVFQTLGVESNTSEPLSKSEATAKLDSLAKARAAEKGVDYYTAYDQVRRENDALYKRAIAG